MNPIKILPALVFTILIGTSAFAQSGLQSYTPSVLLSKGQMEFKLFNNLYTQTKVRDENGTTIQLGERQSFLNHQLRFLYGISETSRINVGMEINTTTAWYGGVSTSTLLSGIGPTIKFVPLSDRGNFSIQSTFLIPLNGEQLENPRFINHNRRTWWTQFFYDHSMSTKWNLFFEVDLLYRFKEDPSQNNFFRVPVSTIVSYFASSKWTIYSNLQYAAAYGRLPGVESVDFGRMRWFTQLGVGTKYLLLDNLELELSYANFLWSRRDGAGEAFNFGLRWIR
ncbi:MAG: hypothetical protein ABJF11_17190 [Reichenbachiella sp.]|uniref:hypothetical protein n=1 Tax=Reichenbachiella sp. TaxID=2184521 RepID=UPI003264745F